MAKHRASRPALSIIRPEGLALRRRPHRTSNVGQLQEAPLPLVLRKITDAEYDAWFDAAVPAYAEDKIVSGAWPAEGALQRSRREHTELLPHGPATVGHNILSILNEAGATVGALWFASEERGTQPVAYVYNIWVHPQHRRKGYATRALLALDELARSQGLVGVSLHVFGHNLAAQALYAKLGFRPSHFNLFKPIGEGGA